MVDYYNLLGVPRTATAEEIRAAFRREAKRSHPDAHAQESPRKQEQAQQRFIQLAQAYETLGHVGMRRAYDEKLAAAEAAAKANAKAGAKPGASGTGAAPGAPHNPNAERQQRADHVRRPSAEGERQARMDEQRRATERQAEARQRQAERARRERERAEREAEASATQRRRAHVRAESARAQTYGRPPQDRRLEDIVQDVESLLGRFGLDLRTPLEVVWDTLLTWARRVFRDSAPPRAAKPRPEASTRAKARPHAPPRQEAPRPEPPPRPPPRSSPGRKPSFRDQAEDAVFREIHPDADLERRAQDLELERDLENLKRDVKHRAKSGGRSAEDDELAALKRNLEKE